VLEQPLVLYVELDEHVHIRVGLRVTARARAKDCHANTDSGELGHQPPAQVGNEMPFRLREVPNCPHELLFLAQWVREG